MIHSLLDPKGNHYQGTLFLEAFMKELGFASFFADLEKCSVYREYSNIDLYITDGERHVIVENKLYAGDQKNQIGRYLDVIDKESKPSPDDVLVIYLTLDRDQPSKVGAGKLRFENGFVFSGEEKKSHYRAIHYKNEIAKWLAECRFEVQNITNLNEAIRQYEDVVKMVNGEYREKSMSLIDYMKHNENFYKRASDISVSNIDEYGKNDRDLHQMAMEVINAIPDVRVSIAKDFFNGVVAELMPKLGDEWDYEIKEECLARKQKPSFIVYQKSYGKNAGSILAVQFGEKNFQWCRIGITRPRGIDVEDVLKDLNVDERFLGHHLTDWLYAESLFTGDSEGSGFVDYILKDKEAVKNQFVDKFLALVKRFEAVISTINKGE